VDSKEGVDKIKVRVRIYLGDWRRPGGDPGIRRTKEGHGGDPERQVRKKTTIGLDPHIKENFKEGGDRGTQRKP